MEERNPIRVAISIPLPDTETVKTLHEIVKVKKPLIKKALGAETIEIEIENGKLIFPWFTVLPEYEEMDTYMRFVEFLVKYAGKRKWSWKTNREVNGSEKYAFRCFLLRLGFIGDEYKKDRKILLKRLDGNSAYCKKGGKTE